MFALSNDVYKDLLYATLLRSDDIDIDSIRNNDIYNLFTHDNYVDNMRQYMRLCKVNLKQITVSTFYMHLFDILWTYNNSLHFIVKNLPCMEMNFSFFSHLEDDMCIDFKYNDNDYYIIVRQHTKEHIRYIEPRDLNNPYVLVSLYTKKDYSLLLDSAIPLYQLYVFPATNNFKIRFWSESSRDSLLKYLSKGSGKRHVLPFRHYSEYVEYNKVEKDISRLRYPSKDVVLSVTQYALTCMYCEREYVDLREGKGIKYKKPEIRCFNVKPDGDIHTVNISKCKETIIKKAYKGGHHASPVTHRRRGYYRRCMNGDFIWNSATESYKRVYGGSGTHTFVRPCIVNPGYTPLKNNYYVV